MIGKSKFALLGAALGATAMLAAPAQAKDFDFTGKQVKIVIGFGFGGTYGKYSRMFAEHLKKYIPGNPNIIVESRPGAGGLRMTNFAAKALPANGLNYMVPPDSSVVVQLLQPEKAKYDMRKFTWIGTANQTNVILVVRGDTGVKKWEDLRNISVPMGSTGLGSTAYIMPNLVNSLLGTKMQVVSGYKGSSKTGLAVEQGEVRGAAFNWLFWKSKYERWFQGDKPVARALLQMGVYPDPELKNVPLLSDQVSAEHKPMVDFIGALGLIGRGLAAPPGTPKGAIKVMQTAWEKMIKDPEFIAAAEKRKLRVIPATAAQVQKVVNDAINNAKPETLALAKKMIYENAKKK
jgi:tripartite-type tricarboxylate transporter receptor subunit TctC